MCVVNQTQSFYAFISNNKPLEAAQTLINNEKQIYINATNNEERDKIKKLVSDLSPYPEIKENILTILDNRELSSFREIDRINQNEKSRESNLQNFIQHLDKTVTDDEMDIVSSPRSLESNLTEEELLKYIQDFEDTFSEVEKRDDTQTTIESHGNDKTLLSKRSRSYFRNIDGVNNVKLQHERFITNNQEQENDKNSNSQSNVHQSKPSKKNETLPSIR